MNDVDIIVFEIGRTRVELNDSQWLANQFDADAMEETQLHAWFGKVVWFVDGYDDDPSELYAIPAVRRFFASWRRLRPHWLFFGSLQNDNLKILYLTLLGRAAAVGDDPTGLYRVAFDKVELGGLLADDLETADAICERIGIPPARRLQRARDVMSYFGFDDGGDR